MAHAPQVPPLCLAAGSGCVPLYQMVAHAVMAQASPNSAGEASLGVKDALGRTALHYGTVSL